MARLPAVWPDELEVGLERRIQRRALFLAEFADRDLERWVFDQGKGKRVWTKS